MRHLAPLLLLLFVAVAALLLAPARADDPPAVAAAPARVAVPKARVRYDDGDTIAILWPGGAEVVRILGIDTPETVHPEHDVPYAQPFGDAAAGFLQGCVAMAEEVEILRAAEHDPYGRTLAYLFLNGKNYSVLAVQARLAVENVSHFGDNGLPTQAADVLAAAKTAGPVAFEPPHRYRARMRELSAWLRAHGEYPGGSTASPK